MLRLRTFGGAALLEGDRQLDGPAAQRRRLALLALLAVAGERGVSRDKLASYLWPESDQERARHSLSQWMFTTRRDLKAEDLFLGTTEVRLNPDRFASDVGDFERAIAARDFDTAVACYAGPFLDGFHVAGASEFERWMDGERERLGQLHHRALETLAEQRAAGGDARGAADAWRRLAASDPYSGRVALGLMRALAASGDTAGAIAHARVHATLVREELGAEPNAEVATLAEQLRVAPPEVAVAVAASPAAPAYTAAAEGAAGPGASAPAAPASAVPSSAPPPGSLRRARRLRRAAVIAGPLALVVLTSAMMWYGMPSERRYKALDLVTRFFGRATLTPDLVVVAPFDDRTRDSTHAVLGDFVAERITDELVQVKELSVVPAPSAQRARAVVDSIPRWFRHSDPAIALAREVGAEFVVSGSYIKAADSLYVRFQVSDVSSGRVLRALEEPLVFPADERAHVQLVNAATERAVAATVAATDKGEASAVGRTTPKSYAAYVEARKAWESYFAGDIDEFYRHAAMAATIDTSYMMPVAMQTHIRAEAREWPQVDSLVRILKAHEAQLSPLEKAVAEMFDAAIEGRLDAHLRGAIAVMEAAPGSPETHTYAARVAVNANSPAEALRFVADVDPRRGVMLARPWYWTWSAAALHEQGEYRRERSMAKKARQRFPQDLMSVVTTGRVRATQGDLEGLRELLHELPNEHSAEAHRRWKVALDWTRELRAHGHPAEATELLRVIEAQLAQAPADSTTTTDRFRAAVLTELGRTAEARAAWQRLVARDSVNLDHLGHVGLVAARANDRATAAAMEQRLARWREPYAHGRDVMWRARIATALGDHERAVVLVGTALGRGYARFFDPGGGPFDEPEVHADPALLPLHRNARFTAMLTPKN